MKGNAAMSTSLLLAFWALSISLVIVPGADWAYAITAGMTKNAITPAISGMLLGYAMITGVVAAGVGVLIASMPAMMAVLTFLGSGYLIWLGTATIARPSLPSGGEERKTNTTGWIGRGFTVSGMNPKALLLFLALLPQFTSHVGKWSIPLQIGVLGIVHILNCAFVYTLVGLGSKLVLRTRPQLARRVSQLSGGAMITVGLCLGFNQVHSLLP